MSVSLPSLAARIASHLPGEWEVDAPALSRKAYLLRGDGARIDLGVHLGRVEYSWDVEGPLRAYVNKPSTLRKESVAASSSAKQIAERITKTALVVMDDQIGLASRALAAVEKAAASRQATVDALADVVRPRGEASGRGRAVLEVEDAGEDQVVVQAAVFNLSTADAVELADWLGRRGMPIRMVRGGQIVSG